MAKPLIQVALDSLDYEQTLALARQAAPYVDIIEIGTPCLKVNGIAIVKAITLSSLLFVILFIGFAMTDTEEYQPDISSFTSAQP